MSKDLGGGQTRGGELAVTWQPTDGWRLHGQFSVIRSYLHQPADSLTGVRSEPGISSPRQQASLRSSLDLGRHVELDAALRYADRIISGDVLAPGAPNIPSYVTFDIRLAWHPTRAIEFALVGQNLAGSQREFNPAFVTTSVTEVTRSFYGKLTWRF